MATNHIIDIYNYIDKNTNIGDKSVDELLNKNQRLQVINDHNIKIGDVVSLGHKYRNEGKSVYNGKDIVALDYELDDYGSVPKSLIIGPLFGPRHWLDVIDHNTIVWIDTSKMESPKYIDTVDGRYNIVVAKDNWNQYNGPHNIKIMCPEYEEPYSGGITQYNELYNSGELVPLGVNYNDDTKLYYPWIYAREFF